jgi:hypothetical protein
VPNFNQRKAVLQDYLSKHNIPFQPLETKKQLYEKIKFKKLLSVFGGISLLSMQFSFPYSFSISNTWSSAFAQTSFVILPNPP